jgi:uncharacterized membrane protein YbhN (UPF0104 family)
MSGAPKAWPCAGEVRHARGDPDGPGSPGGRAAWPSPASRVPYRRGGLSVQPLAPLQRVRPRTLLAITAAAGAFYFILPQLAQVSSSWHALQSARWAWLPVIIACSAVTYLASAAASPTPGGLGAIEAALVAGLTGIGVPPGPAVSAVLTYRLATYWLPVLPGWAALRLLQGRGYV